MVKGGLGLPNFDLCSYCGAVATVHDHVPPLCFSFNIKRNGKKWRNFPWVWACKECNLLLSSLAYFTVHEHARYIAQALQKRYNKLLAMPQWEASELEFLDYNIRVSTLNCIREKEWILHRIATAQLISVTEYEDVENVITYTSFTLDELDL